MVTATDLKAIVSPLSAGLARLRGGWRSEAGGTAISFALITTLVLAPMSFVALDIFLYATQRAKLQDALDAATLWAARADTDESAEIQAQGARALLANLELMGGDPDQLRSSSFILSADGQGEKILGSAVVRPYLVFRWCDPGDEKVWCVTPGEMQASTEVRRGIESIEVALVLDNTGSMQQESRLAALKEAAKNLVDDLTQLGEDSGADADAVKIALIPFSNTVRVQGSLSLSGYNATTHSGGGAPEFMDGRARAIPAASDIFDSAGKTDRFALLKTMGVNWAGCVESRRAPHDVLETAPDPADPATLYAPYFWPDEPDNPSSGDKPSYNTYLTDGGGSGFRGKLRRVQKYSTAPSGGTFTSLMDSPLYGGPFQRGPNAGCILQPVIALTEATSTVKSAIDNMVAIGETHIPLGLMWGWHTLSPSGPFATAADYDDQNTKKFMVLMTDGDNTANQIVRAYYGNTNASLYGSYGYIWQGGLPDPESGGALTTSSTTAERTEAINARMALLCSNIKARKIILYVIGLKVSEDARGRLEACATGGFYWDVDDVDDLGGAFAAIASSIKELRITR